MTKVDVPFLCHGEDEIAKILWKNGEAVGFYSVTPKGTICLCVQVTSFHCRLE